MMPTVASKLGVGASPPTSCSPSWLALPLIRLFHPDRGQGVQLTCSSWPLPMAGSTSDHSPSPIGGSDQPANLMQPLHLVGPTLMGPHYPNQPRVLPPTGPTIDHPLQLRLPPSAGPAPDGPPHTSIRWAFLANLPCSSLSIGHPSQICALGL